MRRGISLNLPAFPAVFPTADSSLTLGMTREGGPHKSCLIGSTFINRTGGSTDLLGRFHRFRHGHPPFVLIHMSLPMISFMISVVPPPMERMRLSR